MVALFTFIPSAFEATTIAVISRYVFEMPWVIAFLLGYTIACAGPAILVPCYIRLQDKGYGVKKGIGGILIAACTLDDIMMIIINGIILKLTIELIDPTQPKRTTNIDIGMVFVQFVSGVLIGILLAYLGLLFNKYLHKKHTMLLKAIYCMIVIIGFPMIAN
jgi:NhaP-type Na+/H+ or K+/H+ antiporter